MIAAAAFGLVPAAIVAVATPRPHAAALVPHPVWTPVPPKFLGKFASAAPVDPSEDGLAIPVSAQGSIVTEFPGVAFADGTYVACPEGAAVSLFPLTPYTKSLAASWIGALAGRDPLLPAGAAPWLNGTLVPAPAWFVRYVRIERCGRGGAVTFEALPAGTYETIGIAFALGRPAAHHARLTYVFEKSFRIDDGMQYEFHIPDFLTVYSAPHGNGDR